MKLVQANYEDQAMTFTEDGWFSATDAAAKFGKRPVDWLKQKDTQEYVDRLCSFHKVSENHFIKTKRGKNVGGTWFHPALAVPFARWCDTDFSIWCDHQIDQILRGNHPYYDHRKARSEAASSFKVMNEALRLVREAQNKPSAPHHYINEARLINFALVGRSAGIDRDALSAEELALLAKIEVRNAVMIGQGFDYQTRKAALAVFAADNRPAITGGHIQFAADA